MFKIILFIITIGLPTTNNAQEPPIPEFFDLPYVNTYHNNPNWDNICNEFNTDDLKNTKYKTVSEMSTACYTESTAWTQWTASLLSLQNITCTFKNTQFTMSVIMPSNWTKSQINQTTKQLCNTVIEVPTLSAPIHHNL